MLKLLTKSSSRNSVFQVPYWFSEVYMFHFTRIGSLDIDRKTRTLGSLSTAASRHKTRHFRVQTYKLVPCMGSKHPRTSQNFTPSICVDNLIPFFWGTKSLSLITSSSQHYLRTSDRPVRRLPTSRPARSLVAEAPPFGDAAGEMM